MSLMKIRERQKRSPAGKEFTRPPSRGRALLLGGLALLLAGAAIWVFVEGNELVAGLVLLGAVLSAAMSYSHWRRLSAT